MRTASQLLAPPCSFRSSLRHCVVSIGLPALAICIASCGSDRSQIALREPEPTTLARSLSGQPGTLDPQKAEDVFSFDVLRDLYEGLTSSTPDGEVVPAAATSWSIEDNGKRYVFRLRREARWSNGDLVTASHFVTAFQRAVDPATA